MIHCFQNEQMTRSPFTSVYIICVILSSCFSNHSGFQIQWKYLFGINITVGVSVQSQILRRDFNPGIPDEKLGVFALEPEKAEYTSTCFA